MITLREFYERTGGNYEDTLRRLPAESMVKRFLLKYPDDSSFDELIKAVSTKNWELGFRAAHTLKGVAQNLGMDSIFEPASVLCEQMRGNKPMTDFELLETLKMAQENVLSAIKEL